MKQFMFLYRSPLDPPERTPEEMQAHMRAWIAWIGESAKAGWMVNPGDALHDDRGRTVVADGVTDGPFVESKELVGGYSIVSAADLDAASALTAGCPALSSGGSVEVRELMNVETG